MGCSKGVDSKELEEWKIFTSGYTSLQELRRDLWEGRLLKAQVPRAILWKVLLLYGTLDRTGWKMTDERNFRQYQDLIDEYGDLEDRDNTQSECLDPLSEQPGMEQDLGVVIIQDVERAFPEFDFFRHKGTVNALVRILYYYAKLNPLVGYRQGMHELAAAMLYVISGQKPENKEDTGKMKLSKQEESDSFALFSFIMKNLQPWYIPPSAILPKSQAIQEKIIKVVDPQLYKALQEKAVEPQIWAIRWTRLLFSREFGLDNTLYLWDALFAADGSTLSLIDYLCAAMILRVRGQLVGADHTTMLTILLNYPTDPGRPADDHPYMYVKNAVRLRRSPCLEVARSITAQYPFLNNQNHENENATIKAIRSPPMSPRQALDSIREAAKTVSKSLDLDRRVKDAREAWHSDFKTNANINDKQPFLMNNSDNQPYSDISLPGTSKPGLISNRTKQLVEILNNSLKILEEKQSDKSSANTIEALEGIRLVRQCLLDPSMPIRASNPTKSSAGPKSTFPVENLTINKSNLPSTGFPGGAKRYHTPTRTLLANSEFSWMLNSPNREPSTFKKNESSNPDGPGLAKDLFELS